MPDNGEHEKALAPLGCAPPMQNSPGTTLLPSSVASLVSLITKSSALSLRAGTLIGGLAINGAKVCTLGGLELGRATVGFILSRAGDDVISRSTGELGKIEAESLLEKSLSIVHLALTQASFFVSAGFAISSVSLESISGLSENVLATIDAILGSTESSKAIAAIITLIRREFKPQNFDYNEKVGVADLLIAICGLALLQKWCLEIDQKTIFDTKAEEVVWDIVILGNGNRADVVATRSLEKRKHIDSHGEVNDSSLRQRRESFVSTSDSKNILEVVGRKNTTSSIDSDVDEIGMREQLIENLPENANVSITTETFTRKTITVEITGCDPPDLDTPPGFFVVEENLHPTYSGTENAKTSSYYRIVYSTDGEDSLSGHEHNKLLLEDYVPKQQEFSTKFSEAGDDSNHVKEDGHHSLIADPKRDARFLTSESVFDNGFATETENNANTSFPVASKEAALASEKSRSALESEYVANQKRHRQPPQSKLRSGLSSPKQVPDTKLTGKRPKDGRLKKGTPEDKPGTLKRAFKKGASGTNLSNLWAKDSTQDIQVDNRPANKLNASSRLPVTAKSTNLSSPSRGKPSISQQNGPSSLTNRSLGVDAQPYRSPSRTSFYSVQESLVESQRDTYSRKSMELGRPASPSHTRTHIRGKSSLTRTRSGKMINLAPHLNTPSGQSRVISKPDEPSIYTLHTSKSEETLALAKAKSYPGVSQSLVQTGQLPGRFPSAHFVHNISRFAKFASAAYGKHFLNMLGLASKEDVHTADHQFHHHEHHSFSKHTRLPPSTILLSSYVDPTGLPKIPNTSSATLPLIHFVTLDHESKAVVLTCRGTLGFEDILTDLTCDYESLVWRGKSYEVHQGMLASARRLLHGPSSRILVTIKAALEEFPDYGLIICGHSLGGGVASMLAILLSEPDPSLSTGTAFVTASEPSFPIQPMLTDGSEMDATPPLPAIRLPAHRPIHVYAYGTPASISPSLCRVTSALITTIINSQDCVPYLSLGVLRDLQDIALAFKTDTTGAKREVRNRIWAGLTGNTVLASPFGSVSTSVGADELEEDLWPYAALKSLRACMLASKLVPPGEVFIVETQEVLSRDAFTDRGEQIKADRGRPATRVVLRHIRDVEKRFGEIRFGISMLSDHSPGRYEANLDALAKGVLDI